MKEKALKVLVVDDALLVLERLSKIIGELACVKETLLTTGYDDAIRLIDSFNPNIVFLDIQLPKSSGIEILEYIKRKHANINVVMISNQANEFYKIICKKLGSDYFVDKSSEFEHIPTIIESYAC
jgi:DNA-binding NarL/FixJ family response regulator